MSKFNRAWASTLLGVSAVALHWVHPILSVVVGFAGLLLTARFAMRVNVPRMRGAERVATLLSALTVYLATRSVTLASAVLVLGLFWVPTDWLVLRSKSILYATPLAAWVVAATLTALSYESGLWMLAVVPYLGFGLMLAVDVLKMRRGQLSRMAHVGLALGKPLPEIDLPYRDGDGEFKLSDFRGTTLLLFFVRGDWCPVCHVMMRIVSREAEHLSQHGVELVFVSPAEGPVDAELASMLGLRGRMVFDASAGVARRFGLIEPRASGGDVPLPVAILVDPDGIIRDITLPDDVSSYSNESKIQTALKALTPVVA
jgi:peroxiredoxin